MKKLFIPAKDVKVRDPQTGGHFPPEGSVRMITSYLTRRVNEGSLIVEEAKIVKNTKKKPAKDIKHTDEGVE